MLHIQSYKYIHLCMQGNMAVLLYDVFCKLYLTLLLLSVPSRKINEPFYLKNASNLKNFMTILTVEIC